MSSIGTTSTARSAAAAAAAGTAPQNIAKQPDYAFVAKIVDNQPAVQAARRELINANLAVKRAAGQPAAQRAALVGKLKAAVTQLNKIQFDVLFKIKPEKLTKSQASALSGLLHGMRINTNLIGDADGSMRHSASIVAKAQGLREPEPVVQLWTKGLVYG